MKFCELEENEYRNFLDKSPQRTFMQTPEMGKIREKSGWNVVYLGVKEDGKIVAASMFTSLTRRFGKKEYYAPRGLLLDYQNKELLNFFTDNLKKYVKEHGGYVFRIDPYVINKERNGAGEVLENGVDNHEIIESLLSLGYKKVPDNKMKQVKWMYVLDVKDKSEEEILNNMKANTRNTIKKTLKNGIEIKELTKEEIIDFYNIMKETSERKGFGIRSLSYYESLYDAFKPRDEIKFMLTRLNLTHHIQTLEREKEEKIRERNALSDNIHNDGKRKNIDFDIETIEKRIAKAEEIRKEKGEVINLSSSMFMLTKPEVIYLTSGNYEEYMFYNSQYLIQWEMIKYAIENGFDRYNFYGITGNFDKNDKDYGIYQFKTGFNGYVEELIGEYAYPTSFIYYVIEFINKIRKK